MPNKPSLEFGRIEHPIKIVERVLLPLAPMRPQKGRQGCDSRSARLVHEPD